MSTALGRRHQWSRELTGKRSPGRKTHVRVLRRRTKAEMPEQRLRFQLPTDVGFGLAPGPVKGLIGVSVQPCGIVEVIGRDRDFICQQAAALIRREAKDRVARRIFASWQRGEEAKEEFEIVWMTGDPAVAIFGTAMRPFFAEGRAVFKR
jgi:hypothetical protein